MSTSVQRHLCGKLSVGGTPVFSGLVKIPFLNGEEWECSIFSYDEYNRDLELQFCRNTHAPYTVRLLNWQSQKRIEVHHADGGLLRLDFWLEFIVKLTNEEVYK